MHLIHYIFFALMYLFCVLFAVKGNRVDIFEFAVAIGL